MNKGWSEPEIERRAQGLAASLRGIAATARNEEELRIGGVQVLQGFAQDAGLELEARYEYALGRGRADSVYGRVLIEFEPPQSLAAANDAARNRHAIKQAQDYAEELSQQDHVELPRILAVVTDGQRIIFIRHRAGKWEVNPPADVDPKSVAHLLFCLNSLQGKALLPENLAEDFRPDPDGPSGQCVRALYHALDQSKSPKVDALFRQWKLLFSEVCGYELGSPKLDAAALGQSYGVPRKRPDPERLFFCVHSYYATLIKLLAAEIVTFYTADFMPSYLGRLESLSADGLRQELLNLEAGGIFRQLGVRNFLEGDFFAWYLEEWGDELDSAVRAIVRALRAYDPATVRVDPDQTRDLLKKLYQNLLPKKLRHDLGEYYTPDWLAELVLQEIGYDGDVNKRILDPACGSGTFPVLEIKKAREWAADKFFGEAATLDRILAGIVGFDLNPLAVITARTNYLIALGDLLRHRSGEIEIPVYLCDSILAPTEYGAPTAKKSGNLFGRAQRVQTSVGCFEIPLAVATQERISSLAAVLEEAIRGRYRREEFLARARTEVGLQPAEFAQAEDGLAALYREMQRVDKEGRNGVWARIIKNFFAPVFAGRFDFVAGNPPWINWENLPDQYRRGTQHLWERYGLFTLKGWRARMGGGKKDLSALFLYVAADKYLKDGGRLGFLITESLFKTSGAGEGFRHLRLPQQPDEWHRWLRVLRVHDLVAVKPFEGAANRTALIAVEKTQPKAHDANRYPVPYIVWDRKRTKPGSLRPLQDDFALKAARLATTRARHVAHPITDKRGAPWITGPAGALDAVQKAVGKSDYKAWAGACTWLNGVYWVRVLQRLPDGKLLIENLHDVGKIPVRRVQARVEPDLVFPLLRGRDVKPWRVEPQAYILMVQDPKTRKGYTEKEMRLKWPLTYAYLKQFEKELRKRSGFRKYFKKDDPFYSIYNVGPQTFADAKVIWRQMIPNLTPAVACGRDKPAIPQHVITLVAFPAEREAHYFCAVMGSSPSRLIAANYSTGKSFGAPHILHHIRIPRFDPKNALHRRLARLSERAHKAAARGQTYRLAGIEARVDDAAAELWGITAKELTIIQRALRPRDRSASRATGVADSPDEDIEDRDEADDSA